MNPEYKKMSKLHYGMENYSRERSIWGRYNVAKIHLGMNSPYCTKNASWMTARLPQLTYTRPI